MPRLIGVSMNPGAITFTVIPLPARSAANALAAGPSRILVDVGCPNERSRVGKPNRGRPPLARPGAGNHGNSPGQFRGLQHALADFHAVRLDVRLRVTDCERDVRPDSHPNG